MPTGLENLKVYTVSEELEIEVHKITKYFPRDEKYRSTDQLRRSSNAVSNNIAEAYHKRSLKTKVHILNDIARCGAEETRMGLIRAAKKQLADPKILESLSKRYVELIKAISGYIRFLKTRENL